MGVPFSAGLSVTAILHIHMLQLVCNRLTIAWIAHLRDKQRHVFSVRENVYCSHPFMNERMKQKLTSFMVSAMMTLLGSASPALLASNTAFPKGLKQGSGVNSITWCTLVTSKPCSRYHLRRGVASRIFSLSYSQSNSVEADPWCYALLRSISWSLQYRRGWFLCSWRWGTFH